MKTNGFLKPGEHLEVVIEQVNAFAVGIAKIHGATIEVPKTLPKERVLVCLLKELRQQNIWLAKKVKILTPSPLRIPSFCQHSDNCQSCSLDFLSYEEQIKWKEHHIQKNFPQSLFMEHAKNKLQYRNSGQFFVTINKDNNTIIGNFLKGQHRVSKIENCLLCPSLFSDCNQSIANFLNKNFKEIKNFALSLKEIYYRYSFSEKTLMVVFYLKRWEEAPLKLLDFLQEQHKEAVSFYQALSTKKNHYLLRSSYKHLRGEKFLIDQLTQSEIKFRIFPDSFISPHMEQEENFYNYLFEQSLLKPQDKAIDFNADTGIFSLYLAKKIKMVYGFEENRFFIRDAVFNSRLNRLENALFFENSFNKEDIQKDILTESIQAIFLKPNIRGLDEKTLAFLKEGNFNRILYIHFSFETMQKDQEAILNLGYLFKGVKPFDILPHTFHKVGVAVFEKKKKLKIKKNKN